MNLEKKHDRILFALESGSKTMANLAYLAKIKERTATKALEDLQAWGLVVCHEGDFSLKKEEPKPKQAAKKEQPTSVVVNFSQSQNLTILTRVLTFLGYEVQKASIKQLLLLPLYGLSSPQVKEDLGAILKQYTATFEVIVTGLNDSCPSTKEHLSKIKPEKLFLGTRFDFFTESFTICKMIEKVVTPHDSIDLPPYVRVSFVAIDDDSNLHQFTIDTKSKAGPKFGLYRGVLKNENWDNFLGLIF